MNQLPYASPTGPGRPRPVSRARRILRPALRWGGRAARAMGVLLLAFLLLLATGFGYGISASDLHRLRGFCRAVDGWQVNPEFRRVSDEYVRLSHTALQARMAGVSAGDVLMAMRSIPGLPEKYAANPGSRKHYDDFTSGDLSAYLHLCGEQGTGDFLGGLEYMGGKADLSDQDVRNFLGSFRMPTPVARDAGAVASVRKLLQDTKAGATFAVRTQTVGPLLPHIAALAQSQGAPPEPERMTLEQQKTLLDGLDAYVRAQDYELWRTKQVTDFLNGIWGQGYGQIYQDFITGVLRAHSACLFLAPAGWLGAAAWVYARLKRRARRREAAAAGPKVAWAPGAGPN